MPLSGRIACNSLSLACLAEPPALSPSTINSSVPWIPLLEQSTTMNPEKRKLLNVNIKQGKKELKETEKLFESLMGKKAEYRFKFIQENANFTNQIDI